MTIRSILTPILAIGLVASPIAAKAESRAATPVHQAQHVEGDSTWIWVGAAIAAVVIIILLADNNNHHHPASP
jgi:hypothetical protein